MTTFGLTPQGFVQKRTLDIIAAINAKLELQWGTSILDEESSSIISQIVGTIGDEIGSVWQLGANIYSNAYPSTAGGVSLALIGLITGATPLPAVPSTVSAVLIGTNGTVVNSGTLLEVASTLAAFQTIASATIATLPAWTINTSYAVGALVNNDTGKVYSCTVSGESAGATGPTGSGTTIVDNTCTWRYCGTSTAAVAVKCQSQLFAPIVASAGTLTVIGTAVGGLSSVVNPLDATLGRLVETDAQFRLRRAQLIRSSGNCTIAALASKLLLPVAQGGAGATQVAVINNPTPVAVNGIPPNSFAPYVLGAASQDIWNVIVRNQPAGIQSFGAVNGTALDNQGVSQPAAYTVPPSVNMYVSVSLTKGPNYPGDAAIATAVAAYGNSTFGLGFGLSVIWNKLFGPVYSAGGVAEVTALTLGTAPSPVGTVDVPVASTSFAAFDSSRVAVTSV